MARLLTIDSVTVTLRNALLAILRPCDEGLLLPQASQSIESGAFKNCSFRINGAEGGVNSAAFSPDWCGGVSLVQVSDSDARALERKLATVSGRKELLNSLVQAIPSELASRDLQVGPPLDCDELERDVEKSEWDFGLDAPTSFVGIFSAEHSKPPDVGKVGINRVHKEFFVVCKAGAGIAASTFHARFLSACAKGQSFDSMFSEGGAIGPAPLRRLSSASSRNRARIMEAAGRALGLNLETVGDQASRNKYRGAVVEVDAAYNTLRKLDDVSTSTWQHTAALDGVLSKGLITLSNASDGVTLFLTSTGDKKISLKNELFDSIPISSKKCVSARDMVTSILKAKHLHCDEEWLRQRFVWKNREFSESQRDVLPFSLWGSHETETFSKTFARELGISDLNPVKLRPEIVCLAGVEAGKLRALV